MNTSIPDLPGYIVLGKQKDKPGYQAIVEHSFSMGLSDKDCLFFWSSEVASATGVVGALLKEAIGKNPAFQVDGKKGAEAHMAAFAKNHPDIEFQIWDVTDPNLPVVIDWSGYHWGKARSDKTISGVVNKFRARNPAFKMREV